MLAYARRGAGPPLVLVHGTGGAGLHWDPLLDRLAAERDVVAVDLPGFGASPPLTERPTVEALARAVGETASALGLGRPHVAGNSLGGAVAVELARAGGAASVCAISPIGLWTRRENAYCRRQLVSGRALFGAVGADRGAALQRSVVARTLSWSVFTARPWRMPGEAAAAWAAAAWAATDFERVIEAYEGYRLDAGGPVGVPMTVAWGTRDRLLVPRQARRLARAMPEARLVWLKNLGHVPTWDDPGLVARVLLDASA